MMTNTTAHTDRKQTEDAPAANEKRFHDLFENSPDAIFVEDLNGEVLDINLAACRLHGAQRETLIGRNVLELIPPDKRTAAAHDFALLARGDLDHVEGFSWVENCRAVPVEIRVSHINYDNKSALLLHVRDITERKRAEEQLRRHSEELEELVAKRAARIQELERQRLVTEKLAATGCLAARIAHEINNPLAGIQNALRLVGRAVPKEHRYYHYVGKIEKEIARIAQIVHQMLDWYRPDQQSKQEFRVDESIRDVVALMRWGSDQHQVQIEIDTDCATNLVSLPENCLRQILYNLIQNALDASPQSGSVRIRAVIDQQCLTVTVSDQGDGILEEACPHIFEPFFTTKSNLATGGLGLGLSVCKSLVEAMNGSIDFESKPGIGTEFRIILPLNKND